MVESGKHNELMAAQSHYYNLVKTQEVDHDDQSNTDEVDDLRKEASLSVEKPSQDMEEKVDFGQGSPSANAQAHSQKIPILRHPLSSP